MLTEPLFDRTTLEDRDTEIAMPIQTLRDLAEQTGLWRGAPPPLCRQQLLHLAEACEALYPSLRLHLYDGSEIYAAPFTVFGRARVAIYLGDGFLSLTGPEHIRFFAQRFDALVRAVVVRPDEVAVWLRDLAGR